LYNSMAGLSNNPTSSTTDKDIDIKNHVKEWIDSKHESWYYCNNNPRV
jgi:hypothetical protein